MRPCLYCLDTTRPKNTEHVLQKAFGGSMTLTEDVCENCNSVVFAPLDEELIKFMRMSLKRTMRSYRNILMENLFFFPDREQGHWSLGRFNGKMEPTTVPQIEFENSGNFKIVFDSNIAHKHVLNRIIEELQNIDEIRLDEQFFEIEDDEGVPLNPILARTAQKCYIIVANNAEDLSRVKSYVSSGRLVNALLQNLETPSERTTINQPIITSRVERNFLEIERAIIKTAINYVCRVLGPDVARCPQLDGLRAHALKGTHLAGVVDLCHDETPAQGLLGDICNSNEHALCLIGSESRTIVLQLFEGRLWHTIDLGTIPVIPNREFLATVFDPIGRTYETRDWILNYYAFFRTHKTC